MALQLDVPRRRSRRLDRRDSASPYGSPGASTGLTPTLGRLDVEDAFADAAPSDGSAMAEGSLADRILADMQGVRASLQRRRSSQALLGGGTAAAATAAAAAAGTAAAATAAAAAAAAGTAAAADDDDDDAAGGGGDAGGATGVARRSSPRGRSPAILEAEQSCESSRRSGSSLSHRAVSIPTTRGTMGWRKGSGSAGVGRSADPPRSLSMPRHSERGENEVGDGDGSAGDADDEGDNEVLARMTQQIADNFTTMKEALHAASRASRESAADADSGGGLSRADRPRASSVSASPQLMTMLMEIYTTEDNYVQAGLPCSQPPPPPRPAAAPPRRSATDTAPFRSVAGPALPGPLLRSPAPRCQSSAERRHERNLLQRGAAARASRGARRRDRCGVRRRRRRRRRRPAAAAAADC